MIGDEDSCWRNQPSEFGKALNAAENLAEYDMLINLAYRMLGSMADAEDVAQETYVRWYSLLPTERQNIKTPAAWCVRVASRLCIDILRSARRRREHYIGPWIPEPISTRAHTESNSLPMDPADRVTLDESVAMAVLIILESMTPAERVSFVLHDVFRYSFGEISEIVGRSEVACRQLANSARRRVESSRPVPTDARNLSTAVNQFKAAFEHGDVNTLISILDPQVTAAFDGGGRVRAALRPVIGADKVARLLFGLFRRQPQFDLSVRNVNGEPGLAVSLHGSIIAVAAFGIRDGLIKQVWVVVNPAKLLRWQVDQPET
ncbi:MAG: RNA polymerase sigma factor SigJ [Actinomycetota bacterium]|nr:RNA polymerase sigma factor SigJ [Actinomycetota bacterium]